MIKHILTGTAFLILSVPRVVSHPGYAASELRSGIQVRVYYVSASNQVLYSHEIIPCGFAVEINAKRKTIRQFQDKYLCKIGLTDSNGSSIPKTRLGSRYGSEFEKVDATWQELGKYISRQRSAFHLADTNGAPTLQLAPVRELFRIPKPGSYTLTLELQVAQSDLGSKLPFRLVRFEPINVPIIHIETEAVQKPSIHGLIILVGLFLAFVLSVAGYRVRVRRQLKSLHPVYA